MSKKSLVLIVGPTAVGKTALCVNIAKQLNAEVFSCDSRQFYKEMSIGTAKPTKEEMRGVPHHFIDNLSIEENYTAGQFEKDSLRELDLYFKDKDVAIMTGGSGLFAKAITHGFDNLPTVPAIIREELKNELAEKGLEFLQNELAEKDPVYFLKIDKSNPQRLVRALEIIRHTNDTYSSFLKNNTVKRPFEIIKIGIELPREELYGRINLRVDIMMKSGLLAEVESLKAYSEHSALNTVGYKEVFQFLNNKSELNETIELIKRNTRRYAKRQLTWFKNQDEFKWFSPKSEPEILAYVKNLI
ncbi:tRNA dimethylallyltransferase [Spirosomataceae bacterium TFI 002]|nr:tRNA dimethylallyltransferase [Spirosomataceae bacterium TFI 002]